MGSSDDDTTYSYVEPSPRSNRSGRKKQKKKSPKTVRAGGKPIPSTVPDPQPDPLESEDPLSDVASRHVLGPHDIGELLERGEYEKVVELLGPPDRAAELSPTLALMYIVARGELDEGAALADLPLLAMETCGKLIDMPARSRASRLVAKRMLGLSNADVRGRMLTRPVRIGLVAVGLFLGLALGWLLSAGEVFGSVGP